MKLFLQLVFATGLTLIQSSYSFAAFRVENLDHPTDFPAGSIVIRSQERALYLVLNTKQAIRYPVAVPKAGKEWSGYTRIYGKFLRPAWTPPPEVKRDHPELPNVIPGGAPNNPMGAAAITLERAQIAIHGTSQKMRSSIGTAASYGCIRMLNEDVLDLYSRVQPGALVLMTE